jgi:hypothetical protein
MTYSNGILAKMNLRIFPNAIPYDRENVRVMLVILFVSMICPRSWHNTYIVMVANIYETDL